MSIERRQHPRVNFNLPIKISDTSVDLVTETKNVSASGAYCVVNKPIDLMTKLEIIILIPLKKNNKKNLKKITCGGVVVRQDYMKNNGTGKYSIGIYFNDIKETDRKLITSYVGSVLP